MASGEYKVMWNKQSLLPIASGLAVAAAIITPAWAKWLTSVDGPDVFGLVTVHAGVIGPQDRTLIIRCDGTDNLELAITFPARPSELDRLSGHPIPAKLLVRIDNGDVMTFNAQAREWNPQRVGVVAEGRTADLIAAVRALGGAQKSIGAGIDYGTAKESANFSAEGSTAAINTVTEKCKLGGAG